MEWETTNLALAIVRKFTLAIAIVPRAFLFPSRSNWSAASRTSSLVFSSSTRHWHKSSHGICLHGTWFYDLRYDSPSKYLGNVCKERTLLGNQLSKHFSTKSPLNRHLHASLCSSYQPHAMVQPPWAQPTLERNTEPNESHTRCSKQATPWTSEHWIGQLRNHSNDKRKQPYFASTKMHRIWRLPAQFRIHDPLQVEYSLQEHTHYQIISQHAHEVRHQSQRLWVVF